MKTIPSGSTIGILGGGQLGMMLAEVAKEMGYRVIVLDPGAHCCAGQFADEHIIADFDDMEAAKQLAAKSDVISYEFENVDVEIVKELEKDNLLYPGSQVLEVTQDRFLEKSFFRDNGVPVCNFALVKDEASLQLALEKIGLPAVLKTCRFGYDGKGQRVIRTEQEVKLAYEELQGQDLIWEEMIGFEKECSVVATRNLAGEIVVYPVTENAHINNILDTTVLPARVSEKTQKQALSAAQMIAEKLNVVGTFCTEFFVLKDGSIVANEIAPRPHNSGHITIEACIASQFENQLRAICGLELGSTAMKVKAALMFNILGDGSGDDFIGADLLNQEANVYLHLYNKGQAKAGRKMGHVTMIGDNLEDLLKRKEQVKENLGWR